MTGARLILLKLHDYCCNIFVSLMRLGSMSRVAKETGYETSFVSRRIAALEKSVASKLFERTTRLCMPTHEAHALLNRILPYVVDLERRLEMASRAVKATSGDVVLKVRCASGLLPFVVRAIKPFRDNHPEYKFEVSAVDPLLPVRRDLRMAVNFNSVQGLRDAVLEDTGVGASLPAYTVATDIGKGRMVRVLPELTGPSLKFRLVRQKTDIPVPEVERFARWLVESWRRDMVFPSA